MADDAVAHASESADQVADFVVARAVGHFGAEIAGLDLARGLGELADRSDQRALQHQADHDAEHDQRSQQEIDPDGLAGTDLTRRALIAAIARVSRR